MKQIVKDGTYNVLTLVIPAVLLIIATPLMARWLGIERYGIWVLCSTMLSLFGILDFGLKETAMTFIPKHLSSGEDYLFTRHLNSLIWINFIIGILSSAFLYAFSFIIGTKLFAISYEYQAESIKAFRILSIGLLPSLSINLLSAVAMGFQRFDLSTVFIVIRNLVTIVGTLFIAALTKNLAYIVAYSVVVSWIFMLFGLRVLVKTVPGRSFLKVPSFRHAKEVLSFGGFSFLTNVSLLAMGVFDKLIIGAMLSPAAVALYSIPMALVAKLEQFFVKFAQALFPYFSKVVSNDSMSEQSNGKHKKIFSLSMDASLLIGFGIGAFLFVFAEHILRLWMGTDFAAQTKWIFRGLLLGYSIKLFNVIPSYVLYSLKKPQINAIAYTISGLTYIGLMAFLINTVSLSTLSFFSGAYLISFFVLIYSISGNLQKSILWHVWPYFAGAFLSSIGTYAVIISSNINDFLMIVLGATMFIVFYVVTAALFSSAKVDKHETGSLRASYFFADSIKPLLSGIKKYRA